MLRDIYIRRVAGSAEQNEPNQIAVELFNFLKELIKKFSNAKNWGEIDYVCVLRTKLDQSDFVGSWAFKNRQVHPDVVKELTQIHPIVFNKRGMLFELNGQKTSIEKQNENRRRFQINLKTNGFGQNQDHQTDKQSPIDISTV